MDNIDVQPGERPGKVSVATVEIAGVHYPVYMLADKSGLAIDDSNPLPVTSSDGNTDAEIYNFSRNNELLESIEIQLKILNRYMSFGHDIELTESDIED